MSDFAHRLSLDRIRDGDRLDLVANEAERQTVAERLDLRALSQLAAHVTLKRDGETVRATGRIQAVLEQNCVATNEPIAAHIDEPFEFIFVPEQQLERGDEEIELGAKDCDVVFHDGAVIDLGTAVADTLALSLDPYPRSAGAESALREAGVMSEEQASPFAVLAQLKRNDSEQP